MNAQIALKSYGDVKINASVASADPHALIMMLFDGGLERMAQMKGAIEQRNIELKNHRVNQAIAIISGLRENLNHDNGGDLSIRLDELYEYIQRRLGEAHRVNDITIVDECIALLNDIAGAWRGIAGA